jgi:broad specificity phosphatase PhoE
MSLFLIRHGQASAGTDNYDQLSARGFEQSKRLGQWLHAHHSTINQVLIGGMQRHLQTWKAIEASYQAAGISLPDAEVNIDLNEFDHHAVFDGFAQQFPDHPSLLQSKTGGVKALGAMIHAALLAWSQNQIDGVPESWDAFGQRAQNAFKQLHELSQERNALVITSGGLISRVAQHALQIDNRAAVDLNLSLRNSGVCEFHWRPYGLSLGSWNALPHLHDTPELWTYY